jgi:hypothetical protein
MTPRKPKPLVAAEPCKSGASEFQRQARNHFMGQYRHDQTVDETHAVRFVGDVRNLRRAGWNTM